MDTKGSATIQDAGDTMKDYAKQLGFYVEDETRKQTESYFEKYWLRKSEYLQKWLPLQSSIYEVSGNQFPDVKFQDGFEVIPLRGGLIFAEDDFSLLQRCMKETGDRNFVVVENVDEDNPRHGEPPLRFVYPASVTWEDLLSGGYVSLELYQIGIKEYFVFGDTGTWGKYVANDYINPLDLVGFQKEVSSLFRGNFESLVESEVSEWLPSTWK